VFLASGHAASISGHNLVIDCGLLASGMAGAHHVYRVVLVTKEGCQVCMTRLWIWHQG
jgi:hypothetical protein